MRSLERELCGFAGENGYAAVDCPDCRDGGRRGAHGVDPGSGDQRRCANCGGSGRLWSGRHRSLSDAGLVRLRSLVGRGG